MTEPTDETQTGSTPPGDTPSGSTPPGDTQRGRTPPSPVDPIPPAVVPPATPEAGSAATPPLRADPNRPAASDWREPPWIPPRSRSVDRRPSIVSVVVGLVLLAIGLYYLLDVTLGISLPAIRWSSLWPVILIAIGGFIVLRASSRR